MGRRLFELSDLIPLHFAVQILVFFGYLFRLSCQRHFSERFDFLRVLSAFPFFWLPCHHRPALALSYVCFLTNASPGGRHVEHFKDGMAARPPGSAP